MNKTIKENLKPVIFIVIVLVLTAISAYPQRKFSGRVVEVIDAKTCVIELASGRVTVVLQYIEVPEADQPLSQTVKDHFRQIILEKQVEFLPRGVMKDKTVGQLLVKGVDVSQQMLRDGAAWYSVPEKSGQDEEERLLYEENEAQAKTEKRGVWGVKDLKPSWEFRAEQEALRQKKIEEENKNAAFVREMQKQRQTPVRRQQVVPQVEMWADVGGANSFDQPLGFGGLRSGYDPTRQVGHISTPSVYWDFPDAGFLQRADSRFFYIYRGDKTQIEDSVYLVGFIITSKNFQFTKSNSMTFTADGQKIALGAARRYYRQDMSSVKELLLYRITRAQIQKLIKAEKITVQIANYKGYISSDSLTYINNLLNAS